MIVPRVADSTPLAGRERVLTLVRELLFSSDADVDLVGPRLSGRSTVVDAVASSAADARRTVVRVNGVRSLRESPLAALHAAGIGVLTSPERRTASALQQAIDALGTAVGSGAAALLVDDADLLDDASTGAIDAVRRATRTPLLRTRARREEGPSTAYVVEVVPLDYEELRSAVAERLGGPVDASAMSRVYALCGGNVGLALALAELAVLEGRLVRGSGGWSATGELWSRALRGALDAQLSGLGPAERVALERIAVTGVGDVASTRGLVDPGALDGLAAAGVLRIVPHRGRRLIALDPPVLADHLRDRAQVDAPPTDAAFVQLVHAAADSRREEASRVWCAAPSPGSALALAHALMADTGMAPGAAAELDRVLAASAGLPGDPLDTAELAVLRARRSVAAGAGLAEALAVLRAEVAGLGPFARLADAAGVMLAVEVGAEPAVPEERLRDDRDLPPPVRARLLEASRAVALRCGRFEDAVRLLDELAAALPVSSDGAPLSAVGAGVRWIDAQLAAGRGRPDEAAELLRRLASALATHGELPTAALALLTSLEHAIDEAGLAEARALLDRQQSELHDAHLAFVEAQAAPGSADLGALAERLASTGRAAPAAALRSAGDGSDSGGFFSTPIALTDREREITRLVATGLSNPEIASRLVLSVRTVESHVSRVMRKTSATNRGELVALALRLSP
ncbi:LuxR C-terminal-related transcriptional regulator [Leifsonia sp. P73]|uniref:LuxR C-terminal-related transcriptional regulator n=1 Tax=Leifsonia sp. P73 TaxID=3423959 RepID=UPI003DA5B9FE